MPICNTCGDDKSESEFYRRTRDKIILRKCKECYRCYHKGTPSRKKKKAPEVISFPIQDYHCTRLLKNIRSSREEIKELSRGFIKCC